MALLEICPWPDLTRPHLLARLPPALLPTQDGGDPGVEVSPRDVVFTLQAGAAHNGTPPAVLAQTDLRCGGVAWCDDDLALVFESWYKTRRSVWHMVAPAQPELGMKVLFDRCVLGARGVGVLCVGGRSQQLTSARQWGGGVLRRQRSS
jgi:hypothetical protein